MLSRRKKTRIRKQFASSSDFEKRRNDYAINQSIEILRNMKKVVIKNWFIHDVMKIMSKAIEYRLKISDRDVWKKATSTNDDWIKITKEMFMSSRLLIETKIVVIMSSSSITRLEKKNRKTIFVVFFFFWNFDFKRRREKSKSDFRCSLSLSCVVIDWEKKKSKSNLCWLFSRSNFVIVLTNVVVYCLWVFVCVVVDFVMIFVNIKKNDCDVWNAFKKRRLSHYSSWRKFINRTDS
jgi:hypothetical protein